MDRQDLKEGQEVYVKGRVIHTGDHLDIVLDKGSFIENAIILHHKKPVIPQFVADWIEYVKKSGFSFNTPFGHKGKLTSKDDVYRVIYCILRIGITTPKIKDWIDGHRDLFARAWLDGYDVEQGKQYTVKLKNTDDYLVKTNNDDYHFYNNIYIQNRKHTREELEDAGFGWVFDCEGVEVQEVE